MFNVKINTHALVFVSGGLFCGGICGYVYYVLTVESGTIQRCRLTGFEPLDRQPSRNSSH